MRRDLSLHPGSQQVKRTEKKNLCEFMLSAMDLVWEGNIGNVGVRKFSS